MALEGQETRFTSAGVLKTVVVILALCLAGYIVGPPLCWHSLEALAASSSLSCPSCPLCDCSASLPLITIPQGTNFFTYYSGPFRFLGFYCDPFGFFAILFCVVMEVYCLGCLGWILRFVLI